MNRDDRLAPCPSSPNCVCSDAAGPSHAVAPYALVLPPEEAWSLACEAVADLPRTTIIQERDNYLHAECRTRIFRFVDDLELRIRPGEGEIAVRSASRVGYSDLGANRRRVEALREALRNRGAIR